MTLDELGARMAAAHIVGLRVSRRGREWVAHVWTMLGGSGAATNRDLGEAITRAVELAEKAE